jgi:hypothetical protein
MIKLKRRRRGVKEPLITMLFILSGILLTACKSAVIDENDGSVIPPKESPVITDAADNAVGELIYELKTGTYAYERAYTPSCLSRAPHFSARGALCYRC